jgi:hypothetical protein
MKSVYDIGGVPLKAFATQWMYKYNHQPPIMALAVLPRNSDWRWLLNKFYFWDRLNKRGDYQSPNPD